MSQFLIKMFVTQFYCTEDYEIKADCNSVLRQLGQYFGIIGLVLLIMLVTYTDFFITKQFPDKNIPWASWNDRGRFIRNIYKLVQILSIEILTETYIDIINFICLVLATYLIYDRFMRPSLYNKIVHMTMVFLECQLFLFTLMACLQGFAKLNLGMIAILFLILTGTSIGFLLDYLIKKKEQEIIANDTDLKNFKNIFQIELYLVVMLHEMEKLVNNEEHGQEKHIHSVISRHMEECENEACLCRNYEPEYDKKFTTVGSKRLTGSLSMGGNLTHMGSDKSLQDLKRLPYKLSYKTKIDIFKKEFEIRIDDFLEAYPKSHGIKLLKSFFNHKYCDSSYKALFVQLENAITCKNFQGKIYIYHLKTQIQDEMNKSLESPLSFDINSLLKFEKYKLDFEKNLEDLSFSCQQFWQDLIKEDYDVDKTLGTAYLVSEKIIEIKSLFSKLIMINPLCIDTSSTYALAYRYILRDESTFSELVTRIQQIKNSSKLEQQREQGIRFFDSDIYSLLMVSGDIKELGRIKQANSSCRFVYGYDPRDLIGSKINKLMPSPFAMIHDRFLNTFLMKGKSSFLERNQPLPVVTKDGYLQMTLFYIKPQVSLHFGLIFSTFGKILNKYRIADDSHEYVKMSKLCVILTDGEGQIHGINDQCSKLMGMPPPNAKKQLSLNDNQLFSIQQICKPIMQQEYEFELVKGVQMTIDSTFLNKERQFRREYPDIACKIGQYQADVGVHKYSYRELRSEINIFVIKLDEKDPIQMGRLGQNFADSIKSKSQEDLTYSEFSITTANSSVASSQVATSKFKTFKSKIQSLNTPTQISRFQKISMLTFFLLLGIAATNFAINLIQNHSFMTNLEVLNSLQILIQSVPEASHATRQMILISNNLVNQYNDEVISDYYPTKYSFYSSLLAQTSERFEGIQNQMQTTLKDKVSFDTYKIFISDVQSDSDVKKMSSSMQTSLNLFSSKILKLSTYKNSTFVNTTVPLISFQWQQMLNSNASIPLVSDLQQDAYFVIQNGLGTIVEGLMDLQTKTVNQINESSDQAAIIAIALAAVSIFLVIVLLPTSLPTLTHIELISQLTLMSLNRLPENFCVNETKACMEIILFLNEQKEGEKSTHQMIKKHEHRKQNRQILKLPKNTKNLHGMGSISSMDSDSDYDKSTLMKSQKKSRLYEDDSASTGSAASNTASISSSKITTLAKVRANQNEYESQQLSQAQRVKRNQGGVIELELMHAKTSELLDDDQEENQNAELTETEIKQREREKSRKIQINKTFSRMKIKKFAYLILVALFIAMYFVITSWYLTLVHQYERMYSKNYQEIGDRIQCYTNVATYTIDTLSRNKNVTKNDIKSLSDYYIDSCLEREEKYLQLLLDGLEAEATLDTFNQLNSKFNGDQICQTLSQQKGLNSAECLNVMDGILTKGLTETLNHFLRNMKSNMLIFDDSQNLTTYDSQVFIIKQLLKRSQSNDLISLHEIYLKTTFEYLREESLKIIQGFFEKMNSYYNMLFGMFVGILSITQLLIQTQLVKKLSRQIIKMYHVVLLIPFSGRTQNDLNKLMMIKL
eukprot:403354991